MPARDMDVLSRYRQVVTAVLTDLAEAGAPQGVELLPVFDTVHDTIG